MDPIQEMIQKRGDYLEKMTKLLADNPGGLNEERQAEFDTHKAEADKLEVRIKDAQALEQRKATFPASNSPVKPDPDDGGTRSTPQVQITEPEIPLSRRMGVFAQMVHRHGLALREGRSAEAVIHEYRNTPEARAAGDGGTVAIGSEGGLLVPEDMVGELMKPIYETNELISRCTVYEMTGNSVKIRTIDETSRANGSRFGGVQAYWTAEEGQFSSSKPKYGEMQLNANKLTALHYATEEEIEDAALLGSVLNDVFPTEIAFKIQDAIVRGQGAGMPLGILNAPCLVTVPKEGGQAADTIVTQNILKMYSRMYGPCRPNGIWLYNQEVEPQLMTLTIDVGTGGTTVMMPPNGLSQKPYNTIFGCPAIPIEQASALGDKGDISFVDMSQYLIARKGGIKFAVSIHLKFDYDQSTFRWIVRIDGQPKWKFALTPYKGASTLSPFVTLANRA